MKTPLYPACFISFALVGVAGIPHSSLKGSSTPNVLTPLAALIEAEPDGIAVEPNFGPAAQRPAKRAARRQPVEDPATKRPTEAPAVARRPVEPLNATKPAVGRSATHSSEVPSQPIKEVKTEVLDDLVSSDVEQMDATSNSKPLQDVRSGGAHSGYSPASAADTQFVVMCALIVVLGFPMVLLCASCYKAHHQVSVPMPAVVKGLGEKRTMRLLIIPVLAVCTTMIMTWLNYKWYAHSLEIPLEETYYVSQVVNFRRVEPWSAWIARWAIWFLVIFGVVEFKSEILPYELMWLPLLWGMALVCVMASGMHQYDTHETYQAEVWGIPGWGRFVIHAVCAIFSFFTCWLEAVMFWWPSRALHACYGALVITFLVCQIESIKIVIEWIVLGLHFVIVWHRAPLVSSQIEQGTWKPWLGCCHCCCPYVEADTDGTNCCPPVHSDDMEIVGGAVAVKK